MDAAAYPKDAILLDAAYRYTRAPFLCSTQMQVVNGKIGCWLLGMLEIAWGVAQAVVFLAFTCAWRIGRRNKLDQCSTSSMPHSSRRTRKPYHPKRIISETEDGWSRVEHTAPTRYGSTPVVGSSLPAVDRWLTVQKLLDEHSRCKRQWVESEARRWLQQLLARQTPEGGWSLNKAVCVALGSPSLSWANRLRSVWQLVMFMDLVDMGTVQMYVHS